MEKTINKLTFLSLAFLACSQVYAGNTNVPKLATNDIAINNICGNDIAYRVVAPSGTNNLYGVKSHKNAVYHAKTEGDHNVAFEVGECKRIRAGLCVEVDASSLHNINNERYDAYLVRAIQFNSITSANVICLDGGTTSCIAK